ncbi:Phytosulfokines 5 [Hordeum vulgare]|nr:Phytosulfokines 5 [Hordeum vulgare]
MATAKAGDVAARAAIKEEAIHARVLKKWQQRNTHALAREQSWLVREMAKIPPKKEKEASDGEDSDDDEQIRLDPYSVFDRYFREKEYKGSRKDKGNRR